MHFYGIESSKIMKDLTIKKTFSMCLFEYS